MLYAVIVAGGQGTRLWPASRKSSPKQLQPFEGDETMLQRTYKRVCQLVEPQNVRISTNVSYVDEIVRQLPDMHLHQLILEPESRGNAPAVALSAAVLNKEDPDAVMFCAWADHVYSNEEEFMNKVKLGVKALEQLPDQLINIPAYATRPATGFGYLETGEVLATIDGVDIYRNKRFVEKPPLEVAQQFLDAGNYYWNTASFVWETNTILEEFKKYEPEMYQGIMQIVEAWGTPAQHEVLSNVYPAFAKTMIEYAVFEKSDKIAVLPVDAGWKDIGSWLTVHEMLTEMKPNKQGLVTKGKVRTIDTDDSLIFNENEGKLVAVVGMKDVVVVDTPDALLVMPKSRDQEIKKIITHLEENGDLEHL